MSDNKTTICELCLAYVSGECSLEEQHAFEHHLSTCHECQVTLNDLQMIWESLPAELDLIEPPKDLKKKVMNTVTGPPIVNKYWITVSAALFALLFVGSLWIQSLKEDQVDSVIPVEQALSVSAAHIEKIVTLQSVTYDASSAYGVACIVNNGEDRQFVVYVFNATETTDQQVYQVWLMNDNKRSSAGTFQVNSQGVGLLAMPISSDDFAFRTVSISLEPDDKGNEPRGAKVFESVQYN